jgi:hydrogenase maturation protease HycI
MATIKTMLRARLADAGRVAILGVGSELRGDDAAGILVIKGLGGRAVKIRRGTSFKVFNGATAPENITGEVKRFRPTHIVMVDTVEFGKRPGTVFMLESCEVGPGVSFSTHKLPAKVLIDYLADSLECDISVIGIQPKNLDFGRPVSREVALAVDRIICAIRSAMTAKRNSARG